MLRKCSKAKFRPGRGEITLKKQKFFKEAFDKTDEKTLDRLRCKLCWHCREHLRNSRNRLSNLEGKCKEFVSRERNNAICQICNSNDNIEFDHIDPNTKIQNIYRYDWWKWNGGLGAIKE